MPNTRALKNRIRSVDSTKQITKAMQLVAASKMRRAQEADKASAPYTMAAEELLSYLASQGATDNHPLFKRRKITKRLIIVIASDKGLAGAYNTNVLKKYLELLKRDDKRLQIELFLFNKNYTPHFMPLKGDVEQQLRPLFLFDYINQVNLGAGTGLGVRDYELSEAEENVLLRTDLAKVGRAETLIHLIEHERDDIVEFSENEHEFKRMKGVIARFTDPNDPEKIFYTAKLIQQGQTLKSALAWEFSDGKFGAFKAEVGLTRPRS